MDSQIESVIADSKALLALAGPAFEAQKKVAALETSKVELLSKVASLEKASTDRESIIKTAADEAAEFFDARGMLKVSAEDFSARLQSNPAEIFSVVQKFTDASTQKEAGAPMENTLADDGLDPIQRFVRS